MLKLPNNHSAKYTPGKNSIFYQGLYLNCECRPNVTKTDKPESDGLAEFAMTSGILFWNVKLFSFLFRLSCMIRQCHWFFTERVTTVCKHFPKIVALRPVVFREGSLVNYECLTNVNEHFPKQCSCTKRIFRNVRYWASAWIISENCWSWTSQMLILTTGSHIKYYGFLIKSRWKLWILNKFKTLKLFCLKLK